jgi:hypothetical protein
MATHETGLIEEHGHTVWDISPRLARSVSAGSAVNSLADVARMSSVCGVGGLGEAAIQ